MKRIEAEAVISAKDATGTVFAAIAAKIAKLSNTAKSASSRASAAESRAGAMDRGRGGRGMGGGSPLAGGARGLGYVAANTAGIPGIGTIGAGYLGVQAYKGYADTELSLKRIGITAEASDEQISGMQKTLREMAIGSGQSFQNVRDGLESIVAAGFDLDKAMASMPAVTMTAQAAGAEIKDIANTAVALQQSFEIEPKKLQEAFDVLNTAGKSGKFELKDLARYMASIGPAAKAAGFQGMEGLQKMAAMLETIRAGTGTSDEAADSMINILQKMESTETVNKFKTMGVDLPKAMESARKEGRNLIEVFTELTEKATKGDLSKLPNLIADLQFARGTRALLTYGKVYEDVMSRLKKSAGSTSEDNSRVMETQQIKINKLSESWNRFLSQLGEEAADLGIGKALDRVVQKSQEVMDRLKLIQSERDRFDEKEKQAASVAALDEDIANLEKAAPTMSADEKRRRELAGLPTQGRDKRLEELRLKRFDMEAGRAVPNIERELFSAKDLKDMKEAVEQAERFKEFENEIRSHRAEFIGPRESQSRTTFPMPRARPDEAGSPRSDAEKTGGMNTHDLPPVTATLTGTADVKGSAEVNVHMKVDASPELKAVVADAKAVTVEMRGMLRSGNGPGSTGKTSPDSGAPSTGASGKW